MQVKRLNPCELEHSGIRRLREDELMHHGVKGWTRGNQAEQGAFGKAGRFAYKNVELKAGKLKQASNKSAAKAFEELYNKDSDFKSSIDDMMKKSGNLDLNPKVAVLKRQAKGGNMRKMYEYYNVNGLMGGTDDKINNKFYSHLKSKGYGAIQDINDRKYSGYNAKNPMIIFDKTNVSKIGESLETNKNKALGGYLREHAKDKYLSAKGIGKGAAVAGAIGAGSYYELNKEQKKRAAKKTKKSDKNKVND